MERRSPPRGPAVERGQGSPCGPTRPRVRAHRGRSATARGRSAQSVWREELRPKAGPFVSQIPHAAVGIPSVERAKASRSFLLPRATIRPLRSGINHFLSCNESARPSGFSAEGGSSGRLFMTNPCRNSPPPGVRDARRRLPIAVRSAAIASVRSAASASLPVRARTSCIAISAELLASSAASMYSRPSGSSISFTERRLHASILLGGPALEAGPGPHRDHGSQDRGAALGPGRRRLSLGPEPAVVGRVDRCCWWVALPHAPSCSLFRQPRGVRSALDQCCSGIAVVSRNGDANVRRRGSR